MNIILFEYDLEKLTGFANQIRDHLAEKLDLPVLNDYVIVIHRKGMLGKFMASLLGKPSENWSLSIFPANVKKQP